MLIAVAFLVVGLGLLTFGAERFVVGAAVLARNLGMPPIFIGLTVVGFATSAPEMLVSAVASVVGSPDVAIGNAIGSNIANMGLVLGATALVRPLAVHSATLKREYPLMFVAMLAAWLLMADGQLSRLDGVLLLSGLGLCMVLVVRLGQDSQASDPLLNELNRELQATMSTALASVWLCVGLTLMVAGSNMLVEGAITVARHFGVSELVIGLTIVAIGTSLPELAASIMSALKGEPEIALGNVLGSNMFNILGVMALPGLLAPTVIEAGVLRRDFPVMVGLAAAMYVFASGVRGHGRINRWEGGVLLGAFVGYQLLLLHRGG